MLNYLNDPALQLRKALGCDYKEQEPQTNFLWENPFDQPVQKNEMMFLLIKNFKDTFSTESGQIVLNYLVAQYLDKPTCDFSLKDGKQVELSSVWRDGNNHVVRQILEFLRNTGE